VDWETQLLQKVFALDVKQFHSGRVAIQIVQLAQKLINLKREQWVVRTDEIQVQTLLTWKQYKEYKWAT
jgi:hypothetical protein